MARKRDNEGKYVSEKEATEKEIQDKLTRDERSTKNTAIGSDSYNMYLDSVFRPGTEEDWIMADGVLGPFARIPIRTFKTVCLPHTNDRLDRTRLRFFNFEEGEKQADVGQEFIINGLDVEKARKRRRIFRGRRLPRLGWKSEMKKVNDWIDEGIRLKVFKVSKENVKSIVREELLTCKKYQEEVYYEGYPPVRKKKASTVRNDEQSGDANQVQPSTETSNGSPAADSTVEEGNSDVTVNNAECANQNVSDTLSQSEKATLPSLERLIAAAEHSTKFCLLCKVADNFHDLLLDCIAIALLQSHHEHLSDCDPLLLDALQYAKLKKAGGRADPIALRIQEHRVRATAQMLKAIRRTFPHLPSYEDMRSADLPLLRRPPNRRERNYMNPRNVDSAGPM